MITQALETQEKPSIFDIESVATEYPKTVANLSKPISNQKVLFNNQTN